MKRLLHFAPAFLAGVAVAALVWLPGSKAGRQSDLNSPKAAETQSSAPSDAQRTIKDAHVNPVAAEGDAEIQSILIPIAGESLQSEFQRMLRELVQAPGDERAERLFLLLARLQRGGAESIPIIREFLRSGSNLPRETILGTDWRYRENRNLTSFRELLVSTLVEIASADPKLSLEVAKTILPEARCLGEALGLIEEAEKAAPNAIRSEAIDALARLAGEKRNPFFEFPRAMGVMARLHAEELVPIYAAELERRPYSLDIESFLAALWSFPDETRMQMSQRMIDSESVRKIMRGYPSSWKWLDFRQPEFRAAVVNDFQAPKMEELQMYLLRALPEDDTVPARTILNTNPASPTPGAPGSREQAIGRLALLDELAPFCKTPLLEQHLAESRRKLTAIAEQP